MRWAWHVPRGGSRPEALTPGSTTEPASPQTARAHLHSRLGWSPKHYAESVSGSHNSKGLGEGAERLGAAGESTVLETLADGTKVKRRKLRMRACNELNAKGKLCAGHLKRWYQPTGEAAVRFGAKIELYRCERCHTVYLPHPDETPRTGTLAW